MSNGEQKNWALVLGASSGFGGAASLELARAGYSIFGVHLDRKSTMPNVERLSSCARIQNNPIAPRKRSAVMRLGQ